MASSVVWRTSSYSNGTGGACVEVAALRGEVLVRDTKDRTRPAVRYSTDQWRAFVAGVKAGEFHELT